METKKTENETLAATVATQQESLTAKDAEIETLTAEVNNLDAQLIVMESAAVNTSTQYETLKTEASEKDVEIGRLTAENATLQTQIEQLTADKETLQTRLDRLEGKSINLYATTNMDQVRLRANSDTGSRRMKELKQGKRVLVLKEVINSKNETWAYVEVDGENGYIMMQYLDLEEETE